MIRQEEISLTIDSQKEEFSLKASFLERDELKNIPVIDSFATIITGIRRCGKSTLLLQYLKQQKEILFILILMIFVLLNLKLPILFVFTMK